MVCYSPPPKLTARELRFLRLFLPDGSIAVGLEVGARMLRYGYLTVRSDHRYILSEEGRKASSRVRCAV
jgi:hypothetical protein